MWHLNTENKIWISVLLSRIQISFFRHLNKIRWWNQTSLKKKKKKCRHLYLKTYLDPVWDLFHPCHIPPTPSTSSLWPPYPLLSSPYLLTSGHLQKRKSMQTHMSNLKFLTKAFHNTTLNGSLNHCDHSENGTCAQNSNMKSLYNLGKIWELYLCQIPFYQS